MGNNPFTDWEDDLPGLEKIGAPEKPAYVLNAGQQAALDTLSYWLTNNEIRNYRVLLEGWAGTGKTFTINRVVEAVKQETPWINFGLTAPTHKAVRQLRKHSELKEKIDFGTIHSFLGLKEVIKDHPRDRFKKIVTYEPDYESEKGRRIDSIHVLIVDESSMLRDDLYQYIEDAQKHRPQLKVVFMGDGLQIPPVREDWEKGNVGQSPDAIPFIPEHRMKRNIEHLQLTEVVRQGQGNPIIDYSRAIREQVKHQTIDWTPVLVNPAATTLAEPNPYGVEIIPKEIGRPGMIGLFSRYFNTDAFRKDPDYVKVVAWRNTTVDYINSMIRGILYGENLPRIIEGDKLVMDKPLIRGDKVVIANNEELEVLSVELGTEEKEYTFHNPDAYDLVSRSNSDVESESRLKYTAQVYKCKVRTPEGQEHVLHVLTEADEKRFATLRQQVADAAKKLKRLGQGYESSDMWKLFFRMEKWFAQVKYNYCLTAHKAQGSTYDYCISMEWDIQVNRDVVERNRIRYVAATRARNKLFIVR